jgi:hypothetical protein
VAADCPYAEYLIQIINFRKSSDNPGGLGFTGNSPSGLALTGFHHLDNF